MVPPRVSRPIGAPAKISRHCCRMDSPSLGVTFSQLTGIFDDFENEGIAEHAKANARNTAKMNSALIRSPMRSRVLRIGITISTDRVASIGPNSDLAKSAG